jgi:alpha-amylase/alpha-mannosidase (GH57 family)
LNRINLVILWHMHQPQYRDPGTGRYLLPWTRLHALKDYWGMVKILEEFPGVHATFNVVPSLAAQIQEYASGQFRESWFEIAFTPAEKLRPEAKREAIDRAFQVNDNFLRRWPRFGQLASQVRSGGAEACVAQWSARDWRDLQVLSQLAWMDEEYLTKDPAVRSVSDRGQDFTEQDKRLLLDKQRELLAAVLPEYRLAAARGQIEISTTPYYHPILPLLCDTDIARLANPDTPVPQPAFRYPEDAREQLVRARQFHERVFGKPPAGLWPSEGSVSDEALEIAAELGFRWFATDEGVLGRTRNVGFWRDASGYPENGPELYTPWRLQCGSKELYGFFRDHYLSDLVGFVYSRMDAEAAAQDLHQRIRAVGSSEPVGRTATVSLILDGENAWEYYPGNGRDFLRRFYELIERDADIFACTVSEAVDQVTEAPVLKRIFPASWINANFDVWIGHAEDVRAWELLRDAREAFERAKERRDPGRPSKLDESTFQGQRVYDAILAAEGSDWCWWFGPEHGSANDAEFDALYRRHLTEIYNALGEPPPAALSHPVKRAAERGRREPPSAYLNVKVDGRETTYFEWLGAGLFATDHRGGTMHGRRSVLREIFYGFGPHHFWLRVDPVREAISDMEEFQVHVAIWDSRETRVTLGIEDGKLRKCIVENGGMCLLHPEAFVSAAYGSIVEVGISRTLFDLSQRKGLLLNVAIWQSGLPVDVLPLEGMLEVRLGEENFSWASDEHDASAPA